MTARVVVTGIGAISSAGIGADMLLDAVAAGQSCLFPVKNEQYHPPHQTKAGLVQQTLPALDAPLRSEKTLPWTPDRFVLMALLAAEEALKQSKTPISARSRMGAIVGTCSGPALSLEKFYADRKPQSGKANRMCFEQMAYASAARALAYCFGLSGFIGTVTTACSASTTAIGAGLDLLRSGLLDFVLAGGTDAYSLSMQIGFDGLKATCDGMCAPFSKPIGMCLGEGAAFLMLERLESARLRGVEIMAEIIGFSTSNDAHHCSAPDPSGQGQALALMRALRHAGLQPNAVGYINAHGTGTNANDKAESGAVRKIFGSLAGRIPVSSQKAVFGHTLGAAGALETAAAILSRKRGLLPPTARFSEPREGCALDYVPNPNRPWPDQTAWIKQNFAFGGHNACLAISAPPTTDKAEDPGSVLSRVCITGMGLITSAGTGRKAFRILLENGVKNLVTIPDRLNNHIQAALVPENFDLAVERRLGLKQMDKPSALASLAAYLAMLDAGISLRPSATENIGIYLAHASGSNRAESAYMRPLIANGYSLQSVADFPFVVPNSTAGTVCRSLGLKGHNAVFCSGTGAGLVSLLTAASAIENNHAEILLAGSVDVLTNRAETNPPPASNQPMAEAAIIFALESETSAMTRGAAILARIEGMSASRDPAKAMQEALARAKLDAQNLSHIRAPTPPAGHPPIAAIDITKRVGATESCRPLLNMAAALLDSTCATDTAKKCGAQIETNKPQPFLTLFPTRHDHSIALILRPFPQDVNSDAAKPTNY